MTAELLCSIVSAGAASLQTVMIIVAAVWWDRRDKRQARQQENDKSKHDEQRHIHELFSQLANLVMQYPAVEDPTILATYDQLEPSSPERIRYENYAILVSNAIECVFQYEVKWGDKPGCDVQELLEIHSHWLSKEERSKKGLENTNFGRWTELKRKGISNA